MPLTVRPVLRKTKQSERGGDVVHIVPESRKNEVMEIMEKANEANNLNLTWDFEDYEEPPVLKCTIEITGLTEEDLIDAINEVRSKVGEGYTSGFDENDSGSYVFNLTTDDSAVEQSDKKDERVYLLSYYLQNNIVPISEELGRHEPDSEILRSLVAEYLEKEFNITDENSDLQRYGDLERITMLLNKRFGNHDLEWVRFLYEQWSSARLRTVRERSIPGGFSFVRIKKRIDNIDKRPYL
jgi:hypothetical protein